MKTTGYPDDGARLNRLRNKAASRARKADDIVFRQAERARAAAWRTNNRAKVRAQKQKARAANYNRPFVAIDSEGQNYPGQDIVRDGVRYAKHDTYLWGAAADDGKPARWLTSGEPKGLDKKPLGAAEILDYLLDLPSEFGSAVYIMFSASYDVTQILKSPPLSTVWEIVKRETYPDDKGNNRKIGHAPVFWKGYAIGYLKGKSLELWRLADPNKPYNGKRLNASAHIEIYDVFGFFQSSFSAVVDSMVARGRATKDEADFIRSMKSKRSDFANEPIEEIKKYTTLELRLLARMMTDLRTGFDRAGLRLRDWHGAGAAASALMEREKTKKHYGNDIAAAGISPQQEVANHSYIGARIETLRQGFMEGGSLHVYDIASAYSAALVDFPSLANGKWINKRSTEIACGSLLELRAMVEAASLVCMFKVQFQFPVYEKFNPDPRKAIFIPFYPLPYREKRGGILFPANGYGWYMRDDVLAAIAWLERFVPEFPRCRKSADMITKFDIEEAWIFELRDGPRANERPFEFIRDRFQERRRIQEESERADKYDIREKAIKLSLSSIYGKLAQSVGTQGKVPALANPYYAAATTAYCRRRLVEAALIDPHSIVFFATDGIVSTRELHGLARVRKKGDVVNLGDWEYREADGGLFVLPGVYTYGKVVYKNGERTIEPVTKVRGGDAKKYDATIRANQWLIKNVLGAWRMPFDPAKPEQFPRIVAGYQKYITIGNALASPGRWKLAGRWTPKPDEPNAGKREILVHSVGNKRELIPDERCWPDYVSIPGREAGRCHELIRTLPAMNNDLALSRPRRPEWYDESIGAELAEREEQEEIAAGFE